MTKNEVKTKDVDWAKAPNCIELLNGCVFCAFCNGILRKSTEWKYISGKIVPKKHVWIKSCVKCAAGYWCSPPWWYQPTPYLDQPSRHTVVTGGEKKNPPFHCCQILWENQISGLSLENTEMDVAPCFKLFSLFTLLIPLHCFHCSHCLKQLWSKKATMPVYDEGCTSLLILPSF